MESQTPLIRWGMILIPLIVLTATCVPGMDAMGCGGRCREGTTCSERKCQCQDGYYGLRRVPGSNVKFCSRPCKTDALLCPAKTTCKEVNLRGNVLKLLCECSAGSRLLSTGECLDVTRNTCGDRCGQGTSCVAGDCRCQPGLYGPVTKLGIPRQFCLQGCGLGLDACPDNTRCRWVEIWNGNRRVCDCAARAKRSATGQCLARTDVECGGRCGHRASCSSQYRCRCNEESDLLLSVPGKSVEFCRQRCGNGGDACPANTTCRTVSLTDGKRKVCVCSAGAERSGTGQCLDIDECAVNRNLCGNNSICTNTEGSYKCTCVEGYMLKEGEEVGCNKDIDECAKKPSVCGNNSVCTNTDGNYTCACAEGYRQRDDELIGCSQAICGNNSVCTNTEGNYTCACVDGYIQRENEEIGCSQSAAASAAADSSPMAIGLTLGIGGLVLLAVIAVVVVVVVRARNRSRAGAGEDIGLDTQAKRSKVTAHAYENVAGQPRGENNPSYPVCFVLPDVLSTSAHSRYSAVDRYQEVDLPQTEQGNDPGTLYSLAGNIEEWEPNESSKYSDLYSNNEIADNKRKQLAAKKSHVSETSPSNSTYNVLSKPHVKPSAAADNTPDNYNTLYDIHLKTTNERPGDLQPVQT